ncbi:thioredoxin [candidate division KSB1 bacterium]|nr:thioredoxin [candidate division KSB1 bacterium]
MSDNVLEFTDATFEDDVINSQQPVIIDFWAVWCGPCRMVAPVMQDLASDYAGKLKVGKLNVDHNPQTAMIYGIRSIPTILLFKNGQIVDSVVGAVPKQNLVNMIEKHLTPAN